MDNNMQPKPMYSIPQQAQQGLLSMNVNGLSTFQSNPSTRKSSMDLTGFPLTPTSTSMQVRMEDMSPLTPLSPSSTGEPLVTDTSAAAEESSSSTASHSSNSNGNSNGNNIANPNNHLEDFLAKEMTDLSVKEREEVYDDLHGVAVMMEESPEFVQSKLEELTLHLRILSASHPALQQAWRFYVQDPERLLMFLRFSKFQVKPAADQLCQFLQEKLRIFGPSKLTQEITMQDLSPQDMDILKCGLFQILPIKDRAGRPIMFVNPSLVDLDADNVDSLLRVMFFMFMAMLQEEDKSVQRKGWVGILHLVDTYDFGDDVVDISVLARIASFRRCLPARLAACHVNYQSQDIWPWVRMLLESATKAERLRVRLHEGSTIECRYSLLGFGIPTYALPIHRFGGSNLEHHRIWIQRRKNCNGASKDAPHGKKPLPDLSLKVMGCPSLSLKPTFPGSSFPMPNSGWKKAPPSSSSQPPVADQRASMPRPAAVPLSTRAPPPPPAVSPGSPQHRPPQSEDVLLGRGIPVMNHPGNLYYRQLVGSHAEEYERGSKFDKTVIAEMILKRIKEAGGRFLKPRSDSAGKASSKAGLDSMGGDSLAWEEIDDQAARLKIASAFRFVRKQKKNKAKA
eukprot:Nitzschia sp. Nitz4//scaffold118_size93875//82307//84270//NITZ4_004801-RA/size93875-augustus-gene-0.90-mRNA-1//1//CDS//3329533763//7795//frame0